MKMIPLAAIIFLLPSVVCCMQKGQPEIPIYFVQLTRIPRERGTITNETATHTMTSVSAPKIIQESNLVIATMKRASTGTDVIIDIANSQTEEITCQARVRYSPLQPILSTHPFSTIAENKENDALIIYLNTNNGIMGAIAGQRILDWSLASSQESGCVEFNQETKNKVITLLTTKLNISQKTPDRPVQQLTPEQEQQKRYPLILRIIGALGLGMLIGYVMCFIVLDSLLHQK